MRAPLADSCSRLSVFFWNIFSVVLLCCCWFFIFRFKIPRADQLLNALVGRFLLLRALTCGAFFPMFSILCALFSCVLGCQGDGRVACRLCCRAKEKSEILQSCAKLRGKVKVNGIITQKSLEQVVNCEWSQWAIKIDQPDVVNSHSSERRWSRAICEKRVVQMKIN